MAARPTPNNTSRRRQDTGNGILGQGSSTAIATRDLNTIQDGESRSSTEPTAGRSAASAVPMDPAVRPCA